MINQSTCWSFYFSWVKIWKAQCKTVVSPVLTHHRYHRLALSHLHNWTPCRWPSAVLWYLSIAVAKVLEIPKYHSLSMSHRYVTRIQVVYNGQPRLGNFCPWVPWSPAGTDSVAGVWLISTPAFWWHHRHAASWPQRIIDVINNSALLQTYSNTVEIFN